MHTFRQGRVLRDMLFTLAFSTSVPMIAQIDRSRPPAPGPVPEVRLANHTDLVLPNGMRLLVVEDHRAPTLGVQVHFDIPPIVQGDKAGYVDLLGDLLAAGAGRRSKAEIDEAVDAAGASLHTSDRGLYLSGLKKNIIPLMELVHDVVFEPTFAPDEFAKALMRLRSSVQQRRDDPDSIAETVGRAAIFGAGHPYGEVTTDATLDRITVEAVRAYHRHFFRPSRGYLVFVGDITVKEAEALARTHFGERKDGPGAAPRGTGEEMLEGLGLVRYLDAPAAAPTYRHIVIVDRPGAPQSLVRVAYPLNLKPKDMRALSAQVMNTMLGGGVFNARLMQNLREDKGYTYGAYSTLDMDRYNGSFTAAVSVRTAVTDSAVTEILAEMERMRSTHVTPEELELAKEYMAGSFVRSLEDPRTVARFALLTHLNGLPEDHYATYLQRLAAITVEDVRAVAEVFLKPDEAVVFVVGDKEGVRRKLLHLSMDPFQPVIELNDAGALKEDVLETVEGMTAEGIIDRYLEVLGGTKAIMRTEDVSITRFPAAGSLPVLVEERFGGAGAYRLDIMVDDRPVHHAVSNGQVFAQQFGGPEERITGDQLASALYAAHLVPEAYPLPADAQRLLEGRTTIGDRPVWKISTVFGPEVVAEYYDVASGLKVRRVERKFYDGQPYTITTDVADHRPVNGVLVPYAFVQDGGPLTVFSSDRAEVVVGRKAPPGAFEIGGARGR